MTPIVMLKVRVLHKTPVLLASQKQTKFWYQNESEKSMKMVKAWSHYAELMVNITAIIKMILKS